MGNKMFDIKFNSRKFIIALLIYINTSVLAYVEIIKENNYTLITLAVLVVYIFSNVLQKIWIDIKSGTLSLENKVADTETK